MLYYTSVLLELNNATENLGVLRSIAHDSKALQTGEQASIKSFDLHCDRKEPKKPKTRNGNRIRVVFVIGNSESEKNEFSRRDFERRKSRKEITPKWQRFGEKRFLHSESTYLPSSLSSFTSLGALLNFLHFFSSSASLSSLSVLEQRKCAGFPSSFSAGAYPSF